MPFTFSHPAILLPLIRKRSKLFSATGLIVGSITPDFEAFLRLNMNKYHGHTWSGMFWFDMPLGIMLSLVFQLIIKIPLFNHLPQSLQFRLRGHGGGHWLSNLKTHYLTFLISLFLGIFSHLLWDACTHLNFSYPDAITSTLRWGGVRVYIIIQYLSSLLGFAALALYLFSLPKKAVSLPLVNKFKFWLFVFLVAFLIGAAAFTSNTVMVGYIDPVYMINMSIGSLFYSLTVVCFISRLIDKN